VSIVFLPELEGLLDQNWEDFSLIELLSLSFVLESTKSVGSSGKISKSEEGSSSLLTSEGVVE